MKPLLSLLIVVASLSVANAEVLFGPFDYSSSSQFTNNFYVTNLPGTATIGVSGGQLLNTSTNAVSTSWVYDTNPDGTPTNANFANFTVSTKFSLAVNGSSFGFYFYNGGSRTNSLLGLISLNSSADDLLRFWTGANMNTSAAGTQVGTTTSANTGFTLNTLYVATLVVQTLSPTSVQATLTVSDPNNVLSNFSATHTFTGIASTQGEIGFRSFLGTGGGTNRFDDLVAYNDAPSTYTWTGGSTGPGNDLTSTAANWQSGNYPAAPQPGAMNDFVFTGNTRTTVSVDTGGNGTLYGFRNLTFDSNAGAFTLNPQNSGNSLNEDLFATGQASTTLTHNSSANQIVNATLLLNVNAGSLTVTGSGSGSLTLNSVRFAPSDADPANAPTLKIARDVTLGGISHLDNRPGILQIGNNATTTFSLASTSSALSFKLGVNSDNSAGSATLLATHTDGFTAAGAVEANAVTFTGDKQMTFSGNFTVLGTSDQTLTFTNTSAEGVTLSGSTLQFGAQTGNGNRVVNLNVGSGARATLSGIVSGSASSGSTGLTKSGVGTLSLSGNNTYTGATLVTAGTLVIDGNQSSATGAVTVDSGATLAGSGTVGGATTIAGHHSPGNSPGIQNFASDLSYTNGSSVTWELIGNTVADRGINFDGINVVEDLTITGTSTINLVFNLGGSSVLWSNSFWNTDRSWLFYDVAGSLSGAFALGSISLDAAGNSLGANRGSFAITYQGSDVFVSFTAIPEPSTTLLLAGALTALVIFRRRRA